MSIWHRSQMVAKLRASPVIRARLLIVSVLAAPYPGSADVAPASPSVPRDSGAVAALADSASTWTHMAEVGAQTAEDMRVVERPDGEQIAAWTDPEYGNASRGVWVAERPAENRRWRTAQRLSADPDSYDISVAVARDGRAVVTWEADEDQGRGKVHWALLRTHARHFDAAEVMPGLVPASATGNTDSPRLVATATGGFVAIWKQSRIISTTPNETSETGGDVIVAILAPGSEHWTRPRTLPGAYGNAWPLGLAQGTNGSIVAAWLRYDNTASRRLSPIRISRLSPNLHTWSSPQRLAVPINGSTLRVNAAQLIEGSDGTLVLVWDTFEGNRLYAAIERPLHRRFSSASQIGRPSSTHDTTLGQPDVGVAVEHDGAITVAWTDVFAHSTNFGATWIAHLPAGTGSWTRPHRFRLVRQTAGPVALAASPDGTLVAVWPHTTKLGWRLATASRSDGAARWSAPREMDTGRPLAITLQPSRTGVMAIWATRNHLATSNWKSE